MFRHERLPALLPAPSLQPRDRDLPQWIRDLISSPPPAGTGLHRWIYRAACALKPWREPSDTAALIAAAAAGSGRDLTREIREAIRHARNDWQPGPHGSSLTFPLPTAATRRPWPARDLETIASVAGTGGGLADLWEASPLRLEGGGQCPDAEELIDDLFPADALLCVGRTPQDACTRPREEWRGLLGEQSFIVPSPMSALTGKRLDGRESQRCLGNTGPRRFLVVEFDFQAADPAGQPAPEASILTTLERARLTVQDLCAGLLLHLTQYAPLLLAVSSGGKSLHGWFPAAGIADSTLECFFRRAIRLGADPATWTRCQLVRLPEGRRSNNGRLQSLCYLDPGSLSTILRSSNILY